MNKSISLEKKISAMEKTLTLTNVTKVAEDLGISPDSIYLWFKQRVIGKLPEILKNDKPGPKPKLKLIPSVPQKQPSASKELHRADRPSHCPECGSSLVWKNGVYFVKNWHHFILTKVWPKFANVVMIQRFLCGSCRKPIPSEEKIRQVQARKRAKLLLNRFIAFAKFSSYLSHRTTSELCEFVYGLKISTAYIFSLTQQIGKKAKGIIGSFPNLPQKVSRVLMGDETFPKVAVRKAKNTLSLGFTVCEHGLIRSVKVIRDKLPDIQKLFSAALGNCFNPLYLLTDYDKTYAKGFAQSKVLQDKRHFRDIVHTIRIIDRHFSVALRKTYLFAPKQVPRKERVKQLKLKKKLLNRRLLPIKRIFHKTFVKGHEGVAHIYIEAALDMLENFPCQIESVAELHKNLQKFFSKYMDSIILLLSKRGDIPDTTNLLESKNALFAPFSKIAKSFMKPEPLENFACGVALFEDFDVKERGKHKGTSAIQRAGLKLKAKDFFEAVGLSPLREEDNHVESALAV